MNIRSIVRRATLLPGVTYLLILLAVILTKEDRRYNDVLGMLWIVGQIGVLACLYMIYLYHLNGDGVIRKLILLIPAIGALSYLIGHLLVYFTTTTIRVFMPVGALLSAAGMTIVGLQFIKQKKWSGWKRFTPLLVGLYPFLVMFPVLIVTGHPDIYLVMLWGVPWLIFGWVFNFGNNVAAE